MLPCTSVLGGLSGALASGYHGYVQGLPKGTWAMSTLSMIETYYSGTDYIWPEDKAYYKKADKNCERRLR